MKVLVAEKCGFCPGVRNAINLAQKTLEEKKDVSSLGHIIHNDDVVSRLSNDGPQAGWTPSMISTQGRC